MLEPNLAHRLPGLARVSARYKSCPSAWEVGRKNSFQLAPVRTCVEPVRCDKDFLYSFRPAVNKQKAAHHSLSTQDRGGCAPCGVATPSRMTCQLLVPVFQSSVVVEEDVAESDSDSERCSKKRRRFDLSPSHFLFPEDLMWDNLRALLEQAHIASREGGALLCTPHARGGVRPPPEASPHARGGVPTPPAPSPHARGGVMAEDPPRDSWSDPPGP